MKKITSVALLLISLNYCVAQKSKIDYVTNFKQGNLLILEKNYHRALSFFLDAYKQDSANANINYKIGLCYLNTTGEKYKAMDYLLKTIKSISHGYDFNDPREKKAPEETYKCLGLAYRLENKFEESNEYFLKFKDLVGKSNVEITNDLDKQMEINSNAQELMKRKDKLVLTNLGDSINTPYAEYGAIISADGATLIFTSQRPGGTGLEEDDDAKLMEDIYYAKRRNDGSWGKALNMGTIINSEANDRVLALSADGQRLFVYKNAFGGDIFYSNLVNEKWTTLVPFTEVNSPFAETYGTISTDGNTFYFSSNRKEGSVGGFDIWFCKKMPTGKWSAPQNMGNKVNTPEDDVPLFSTHNNLFFASKGIMIMGGYDIFKTKLEGEDNWSTPENMRTPISSTDDDLYYSQSDNGAEGYVSAGRKSGHGDLDIYKVNFDLPKEDVTTVIKGTLSFQGTPASFDNVIIAVVDKQTGDIVQNVKPNSATGKFLIVLNPDKAIKRYEINYSCFGYDKITDSLTLKPNAVHQELEKSITLKKTATAETLGPDEIKISGYIKNKEGKTIPGAKIIVKDNITEKLIDTYYSSADSGKYSFILKTGQNYNVSFEADGFLFQSENVNIASPKSNSYVTKNVMLEQLLAGATITLNNIFFDSNKATLRMESNSEIETIGNFLKRYPKIIVEVGGHTDNKGAAAANLVLSQNRSKAVVTELLKLGIEPERLVSKGYGASMPKVSNTLPNGKPDATGMQMNRRVELKVLQLK